MYILLGSILGLYWGDIGVILGLYWGYIGATLGLYWGYIGIMQKDMETTRVYRDSIEYIMQLQAIAWPHLLPVSVLLGGTSSKPLMHSPLTM